MGRRSTRGLAAAATVVVATIVPVGPVAHAQYPPEGPECATFDAGGNPTTTFSRRARFSVLCSGLPPRSRGTVFFVQSRTRLGRARVDADGDLAFTGRIPRQARSGSAAIQVVAGGESVTVPISIGQAAAQVRANLELPRTGADVAALGSWGAALLLGGYMLVRASRRRLQPVAALPITWIWPAPGEFIDVQPSEHPTAGSRGAIVRGDYSTPGFLCEADILDLPPACRPAR